MPRSARPARRGGAATATFAAALAMLAPGSAQAAPTCTTAADTSTCTFASTGAEDSYTVPAGVFRVQVTAVGAPGGTSVGGGSSGGRGASASGTLAVSPGQVLYVAVGGRPTGGNCFSTAVCIGGFNGGGSSSGGGGGGGASDVRTISRTVAGSLASRRIVGAGGGGGGRSGSDCRLVPSGNRGGAGGDAGQGGGGGPTCSSSVPGTGGAAGTQTAGGVGGTPRGENGSVAQGGTGGFNSSFTFAWGGGGGGGLFGGGGGGEMGPLIPGDGFFVQAAAGGGGGGSSLVPTGGAAGPTTAAPSVTIAATPNRAPVPVADAYGATEDAPLAVAAPGVLANDSDPDGDAMTASLTAAPGHGSLRFGTNGSFTYTPDANYSGPDAFRYRVGDGRLQSASVEVSLTVAPVDDPPTLVVTPGGSCGADDHSGTLNLLLTDIDTPASALRLEATSSDGALLPASGVTFGGTGAHRTMTVVTPPHRTGRGTLTVRVFDARTSASTVVTVEAAGNGKDALTGTDGSDLLLGQNGSETLSGLGGIDVLCGGHGEDRLAGGDGADTMDGEHGHDFLTGGAGADRFIGGTGGDVATDLDAAQGDTQDGSIP